MSDALLISYHLNRYVRFADGSVRGIEVSHMVKYCGTLDTERQEKQRKQIIPKMRKYNMSTRQEMIIVAGSKKVGIWQLRKYLRERGYNSIPCRTPQKLTEELKVLPTCDVSVSLVIIEPDILTDAPDDLITGLKDLALGTPFLLTGKEKLEEDAAEMFEEISEYRMKFMPDQNPELTAILRDSGVEVDIH